jgi:uncharacterized protein (TIGR03435 family)
MNVMRATLFILLSSAVLAQQPAFDVASIKPAGGQRQLGADLRFQPGGRLHITNLPVSVLIREVFSVKHYQVSGGPSWLDSDQFDIEARADGDPSSEQMLVMLRNLLETRFRLKVHKENREGAIYALVVAKSGHKLKEPEKDDKPAYIRSGRTGSPSENALTYLLWGHKASMPLIAESLGERLGRPGVDRTGIAGEFDFKLEYAADDSKPENGPSIFAALQEQLGLKLESTRGPIETLIIDHAEKPSAN